jgi:menaquinone-dependent protoporphyrinogen oxidase
MEELMGSKVLVVYATKYGATAEIAGKIGEVLRGAELEVDVAAVDRAGEVDRYAAVVLGSAVYISSWRKEASTFLKANEQLLAGLPVWLFSSGPTGDGDPAVLLKGWRFPQGLQPIADNIKPRDIAVFGGALNPKKLNAIEKFMIKNVKAPMGDFRDWAATTTWATGIAEALKA